MPNNKKPVKPAAKKPAAKPAPVKAVAKSAKPAPKPVAKKTAVKEVKSAPKKITAPAKPIKKITPPAAKKTLAVKPAASARQSTNGKKTVPVAITKKTTAPTPVAKKSTPAPIIKKVPAQVAPVKKAISAKPEPASGKKNTSVAAAPISSSKKPELTPLPKAKDIKISPPKPVVIPKISHNKQRRYEPEFTKSVLDQAPPENNGPTQRYSDVELSEFRELIQRKLETAKKELGYLQGLITRKDEMGGDESDNRYMTMEDGSLSMEREQLSQMASRQITFIDHLEKAMMRIENKTYGICRVTGKLIDKARLRAVPHATLSIEAKMGIHK